MRKKWCGPAIGKEYLLRGRRNGIPDPLCLTFPGKPGKDRRYCAGNQQYQRRSAQSIAQPPGARASIVKQRSQSRSQRHPPALRCPDSAIVKWSIIGCRWYFAMRISIETSGFALYYSGAALRVVRYRILDAVLDALTTVAADDFAAVSSTTILHLHPAVAESAVVIADRGVGAGLRRPDRYCGRFARLDVGVDAERPDHEAVCPVLAGQVAG